MSYIYILRFLFFSNLFCPFGRENRTSIEIAFGTFKQVTRIFKIYVISLEMLIYLSASCFLQFVPLLGRILRIIIFCAICEK